MFDRYVSIVFIVLGVALFYVSGTFTTTSTGGSIGPAELPRFLAVAMVLVSGINLVQALKAKPAEADEGGEKLEYRKFLILLGLLLAYVLLLEPLGYVISTFLFLFAAFQTMERGSYVKQALIAAAFSGGVYWIYVKVALGSLPGLPFGE